MGRASLRNTKNRLLSKFNYKRISFFLQNKYWFKKIYFLICNTYIFCLKIYFSKEIYFSYKFLLARAVRSLPKCIRKKRWREFRRICYSCNESSKAGKFHTFLVSSIKPLLWPEWITSRCKIFLKIIHQTALREARPNTAPFFSRVGLRKFVLARELFVLRPYFIRRVTAKRPAKIL